MSNDPQQEKEANYFAMQLLVPTEMLKRELAKYDGVDLCEPGGVIEKLAKTFGVTTTIIAFRISEEHLLAK